MTEDEAKTKWCFAFTASHTDPRQRLHVPNDGGGEATGSFAHHCIGSACMAWRGRETADFKSRADIAFRLKGVTMKPLPRDVEGHCGLAGAPA